MGHAFQEEVEYGGGVVFAVLAEAVHRGLTSIVGSFGVDIRFGEKHFDDGDVAFLYRQMKGVV